MNVAEAPSANPPQTTSAPLDKYDPGDMPVDGRYHQIPQLLDAIEQRLAEVIEADRRASESFWEKIKRFFANPVDFLMRQRSFKAQTDALVAAARMSVSVLRSVCRVVTDKLHVPEQLKAEHDSWYKAYQQVQTVAESAPNREQVDGWQGAAAEAYTRLARLQTASCWELNKRAVIMCVCYRLAYHLNLNGFNAVHDILQEVLKSTHGLGGSSSYASTRRMMGMIWAAVARIFMTYRMAETGARSIEATVRAAEGAFAHTKESWPALKQR
ncbi:hypothetical protein [Tessaracoccus sp. OH4464_COT-324]|uniref:hypothetical protein n=1 Tax=Tessaracoccus sp. OH4464_COT-324 TaxID=2491059 RepID=UPI000F633BF9|nr:hypothetical protein [Tessaracoccus sp. OH4464_COT-324]RRD46609.1 hypothetical protein EII42_06225 [Tessaracoccus sp. OH4464_COT-324]